MKYSKTVSGGAGTSIEQVNVSVGFIDADGRLAVAAANGGSDHHPDWYHNIGSDDRVTIEVPGAKIPSIATIAAGAERSDLLRRIAECLPGMPDHLSATTREIPVVIFDRADQPTPRSDS